MPAKAARDFSWRCSASGTLRIWTIAPMFRAYKHVVHMSTGCQNEAVPVTWTDPHGGWIEWIGAEEDWR